METSGPLFKSNRLSNLTPRQQAADNPTLEQLMAVDASAAQVEGVLESHITGGYKPNLPVYYFRDEYFNPLEFMWDIEAMIDHDCVSTPLDNVMAPVSQMQIKAEGSSSRVLKFFLDEWQKWLELYVPTIQQNGYPYGWAGGEVVYGLEGGKETVCEFHDFSPRDTEPLVAGNSVVGVQVKNVPTGTKQLSGSRKGFPAKGYWYAHRPRYGQHYGRSQIRRAWKPWRRLTARDGAEETFDIAVYRYGTGNVIVHAPLEDTLSKNQPGAAGVRQSALQRAMELGENLKAGGSVAVPSTMDAKGNRKWDIDFLQPQTNIPELLQAGDSLYNKISKAIGFPPELLEAAETGSGFSGRMIPLQAFLMSLQPTCNNLFHSWYIQVGRPLLWWNFGPAAWVRPKVVQLLKSYRTAAQPQAAQPPRPMPGQPAPPQGLPPGGAQQALPAPGQPAQAQTDAPAPVAGADGKIPYNGPRGGHGYVDAQNRVHYTSMMSSDSAAFVAAGRAVARINDDGPQADQALYALAKRLPDLEPEEMDALEAELLAAEQ